MGAFFRLTAYISTVESLETAVPFITERREEFSCLAATRGDGGIAVAMTLDAPSKNLTIGRPLNFSETSPLVSNPNNRLPRQSRLVEGDYEKARC